MIPTSNALTKLAEFDDSNGALPSASLTLSPDGLFYGTTSGGGSFGSGTIFSFDPTNNVLTNLASFDGANGASPVASLTLDFTGVYYGTTYTGNNIDGTSVPDKNLK
ncbi:MAG: choice-of-anchor tandem repeat GloVer-containing protein, partial [Synechocystis sp.]